MNRGSGAPGDASVEHQRCRRAEREIAIPLEGFLHEAHRRRLLLACDRLGNGHRAHGHRPRFGTQRLRPLAERDQGGQRWIATVLPVLNVDQNYDLNQHRGSDLDQVGGGVGLDPHQPEQNDQQQQGGEVGAVASLGEQSDLVDPDDGACQEHGEQRKQEADRHVVQHETAQRCGQQPIEQRHDGCHPQQLAEEQQCQWAQGRVAAQTNEVEIEDPGALVGAAEQRKDQVEELEGVDVLPGR